MIALIIAAAALTVLLQSGTTALTATRTATRYEEAVARARSHLAAALHGAALTPHDSQGDDGGGFHWHERIAPHASLAPITLYDVSVAISWHDGAAERVVQLDTQQLFTNDQ